MGKKLSFDHLNKNHSNESGNMGGDLHGYLGNMGGSVSDGMKKMGGADMKSGSQKKSPKKSMKALEKDEADEGEY